MTRPTEANGPGVRARPGSLAPGGVIGDGRYRLLAQFGEDSRGGTQFWRARDGQLGRDVALSVILGNPADAAAAANARRTLDRATHTATFDSTVVSRVIDVLTLGSGISGTEGLLGMVVAEWSPGTDLVDLVADGPVPPGAAAALLEPLTSAVEQAHQTGIVLGIDHPQRVRVTRDGALRLAFPGALPEASLRDDVRGLGALLYLLLTGRWPLRGGPEGLPPAPTGPDGALVAPRTLVPGTPQELSNLAVRCLSDDRNTVGGIRTSAAILAVLERVADDDSGAPAPAADSTSAQARPAATAVPRGDQDEDESAVWTTKRPQRDPGRRKRLMIAVGVLGIATVAVLAWLVIGVIGFFSSANEDSGPPKITANAAPPPAPPKPAQSAPPSSSTATPVQPTSVRVYNVSGDSDGSSTVKRVIDGDPDTKWSTQTYGNNFPTLKPGVGIMSRFSTATRFGEVDIQSSSPGTHVEIRSSDTSDPDLSDTKLLAGGDLADGLTKLRLPNYEPSRYLLVWVTSLVQDGDQWSSSIGELGFVPAG